MPFPWFWDSFLRPGRRAEILAARHLREHQYRIVVSPYRVRQGEVDIVAWDGDQLVFVEVKSRTSEDAPEDAVTSRKRGRLIRAAREYMARWRLNDISYRYDIVAVNFGPDARPSFRIIKDAFRER